MRAEQKLFLQPERLQPSPHCTWTESLELRVKTHHSPSPHPHAPQATLCSGFTPFLPEEHPSSLPSTTQSTHQGMSGTIWNRATQRHSTEPCGCLRGSIPSLHYEALGTHSSGAAFGGPSTRCSERVSTPSCSDPCALLQHCSYKNAVNTIYAVWIFLSFSILFPSFFFCHLSWCLSQFSFLSPFPFPFPFSLSFLLSCPSFPVSFPISIFFPLPPSPPLPPHRVLSLPSLPHLPFPSPLRLPPAAGSGAERGGGAACHFPFPFLPIPRSAIRLRVRAAAPGPAPQQHRCRHAPGLLARPSAAVSTARCPTRDPMLTSPPHPVCRRLGLSASPLPRVSPAALTQCRPRRLARSRGCHRALHHASSAGCGAAGPRGGSAAAGRPEPRAGCVRVWDQFVRIRADAQPGSTELLRVSRDADCCRLLGLVWRSRRSSGSGMPSGGLRRPQRCAPRTLRVSVRCAFSAGVSPQGAAVRDRGAGKALCNRERQMATADVRGLLAP